MCCAGFISADTSGSTATFQCLGVFLGESLITMFYNPELISD